MDSLKENTQHEVHLLEPGSLDKAFSVAKRIEGKNMATRRVATNTYKECNFPTPRLTQPTMLTPQKLDEIRAKGLCFNCDIKCIGKVFGFPRKQRRNNQDVGSYRTSSNTKLALGRGLNGFCHKSTKI